MIKVDSEFVENVIVTLEERGWCQKELVNPSGQVCMLGAIVKTEPRLATPDFGWRASVLIDAIRRWIAKNDPTYRSGDYVHVGNWNDAPGRTVDEVIGVLRAVVDE